jgi:hypothetical protein
MQCRVRAQPIKRLARQILGPLFLCATPLDLALAVQRGTRGEKDQSKGPKILRNFTSKSRSEVEEEEAERGADGAAERLLGPRSTSKMSGSAVEKTSLISPMGSVVR